MKKKLIISDVDGTLIRTDQTISPDTIRALETLLAAGHHFAIATGRMHGAAKIVTEMLDYEGFLISCNGAVVKHLKTGEIIYQNVIDNTYLREAIDICRKYNAYFHLYDSDHMYASENAYIAKKYLEKMKQLPEEYHFEIEILEDFEPILKKAINKMGVFCHEVSKFEKIKAEIHALNYFEASQSLATSFDINSMTISKAVGIEKLMSYYGIERDDVIAFGDNENDIKMIDYAGVGIAMGNATASLKTVADFVTASNDEEGIPKALRHLGLL